MSLDVRVTVPPDAAAVTTALGSLLMAAANPEAILVVIVPDPDQRTE
jgi:hypothetical protein